MSHQELTVLIGLTAALGCTAEAPDSAVNVVAERSQATEPDPTDTDPMTDADHPWRTDPALLGKFHPEYPDDLQVVVHEGGPRLTDARPEIVWVRVTGKEGNVYRGTLLNEPHQLPSLRQNDSIRFLAANEGNSPFLVTDKYLQEREVWHISACDQCGMPELFDAPSDLQKKVFPHFPADTKMEMFTSFCPVCGGVQIVSTSPLADQP